MTHKISRPRIEALPLVLATLMSAMGCVSQVSDLSSEEQALDAEDPVGVTAMKLSSAQCNRVVHDAGQLGVYEVPADSNNSQSCWLDLGSVGPEVEALQRALVVCWLQDIDIDGDYGPQTQAAVRNVQSTLSIPADGVYGPMTRNAMADGFAQSYNHELCASPLG